VDPQDLSAYDLTALDSTQKKELVDEFVAGNGSGLQKMLTKLDGMLAKESWASSIHSFISELFTLSGFRARPPRARWRAFSHQVS